jgi:hypothetical protein
MDNKEILKQHNARLNENNIGMDDILEAVNNLPRIDDVLALQDKTVDPTTETQIIQADVEYHGLRKVTVNAMIPPKYAPKYISFYNYTGVQLDAELANLDVSNMTTLQYMFYSCKQLLRADTSRFVNENITSVANMYASCSVLEEINLSNLNAKNITTLSAICSNCSKLEKADLSGLHGKPTSISTSFQGCRLLMHLDIRNLDLTGCTSYSSAFLTVPTSCLIIVKDEASKTWLNSNFSTLTNVKTLAEYQAEGGV